MKLLHVTIVFTVFLAADKHFARCKENTRCILVAQSFNDNVLDILEEVIGDNLNVTLIGVSNELGHELIVDFVVREFQCNFHENETKSDCLCSEIIGVVGDIDSSEASIIHTLASRSNLSITLVSAVASYTSLPVTNLALPNVLDMNPLVHYIKALVSFTNQLNWTRIGLISDGSHYHQFAVDLFQTQLLDNLGISAAPYIRLDKNSSILQALKIIKEYETQIILTTMDRASTCLLLEEARRMDMIWPDYAWIVINYTSNFTPGYNCELEGVIILKQNFNHTEPCIETCSSFEQAVETQCICKSFDISSLPDFQSEVLYDSVLAVVLANSIEGSDISNMSFTGATGLVRFTNGQRVNSIDIVQVIDTKVFYIGSYDSGFEQIALNPHFLTSGDMPRGTKVIVYVQNSKLLNALFLLCIILCFLFVSIILFLYTFFHKEQEIKANSFTISLCMFLGCYLLLFRSSIVLTESWRIAGETILADIFCQIISWFSIVGISSSLILATLLMKMVRIYAIFLKPFSYKKKFYSNYALLIYIILIISPNVVLLVFWSAVDPLLNLEVIIQTTSRLFVFERCLSNYIVIWLGLLLLYMASLIAAVVTVAVKTSPIRYKHYQDTKATNAFTFISILIIITCIIFFLFFNSLPFTVSAMDAINLTMPIGDFTFVLSCQICLFLPKVVPPFRRWIFRNEVKSKPDTSSVQHSSDILIG